VTVRATVLLVALLNFVYFFVEFILGNYYNSLSLISDSMDFLEDASVNLLIAFALTWSALNRKYLSYVLAMVLLFPSALFVWNGVQQLLEPQSPAGEGMTLVGLGALAVNVFCALLIAKHKSEEHGLFLAAFYAARNDAIANVLIIISGIITVVYGSIWPDFVVGVAIFLMNAGAAKAIIKASNRQGI
jgi:Co/Zn/Cd efflux system component